MNSSSSSSPGSGKLKQLRLPFAPLNKSSSCPSASSPAPKKRKVSESELPESKILKVEPSPPSPASPASPSPPAVASLPKEMTPLSGSPRVSRRSRRPSRASSPALTVSVVLGEGPHLIEELSHSAPETPALKDRKRSIRVEIGRISLQVMEARDAMDAAVEKQDFLLAQQHKVSMESLSGRKELLQNKLKSSAHDLGSLESILKEIAEEKSKETPTSAKVRTAPVAVSASPKGEEETPKRKKKPALSEEKKAREGQQDKESDKLEKQKRKEEARVLKDQKKEEERLEKERKKEEERLEKERKKEEDRLEKERKKEDDRVERERKKEEDRLERERKKEAEKLEKERKRNEERLEKLRQEEQEKRKQNKAVQSFASFFLKKTNKPVEAPESHRSGSDYLNAFQVKSNMHLAPLCRSSFEATRRKRLDLSLSTEDAEASYLKDLKLLTYTRGSHGKTWILESKDEDDEVEILDEDEEALDEISGTVNADDADPRKRQQTGLKAKLLQFHENQRPPYWGTWSKSSTHISGRRPFGTDKHFFDYDYDSDDDWEEEEQGESLSDNEDGDKEEEEEVSQDDEEDDGFFVGHGVLDKDEILHSDEEDEPNDPEAGGGYNEDLEIMKQKLKAQAFEEEYKRKKPIKLKPKVFGCLWIGDESINAFAAEQLSKILSPMSAVVLTEQPTPIQTSRLTSLASPLLNESVSTPLHESERGPKCIKAVPEEAMFDLIRLVHANSLNKVFLAKEFSAYWENRTPATSSLLKHPSFSRKALVKKIGEIAEYKKINELNRRAWIVKDELLSKYVPKESPLEIPNSSWSYHLEQPNDINSKSTLGEPATPEVSSLTPCASSSIIASASSVASPQTPKSSLITNFVKVLTPEERERKRMNSGQGLPGNAKKRVTLISLSKSPLPRKVEEEKQVPKSTEDNGST